MRVSWTDGSQAWLSQKELQHAREASHAHSHATQPPPPRSLSPRRAAAPVYGSGRERDSAGAFASPAFGAARGRSYESRRAAGMTAPSRPRGGIQERR